MVDWAFSSLYYCSIFLTCQYQPLVKIFSNYVSELTPLRYLRLSFQLNFHFGSLNSMTSLANAMPIPEFNFWYCCYYYYHRMCLFVKFMRQRPAIQAFPYTIAVQSSATKTHPSRYHFPYEIRNVRGDEAQLFSHSCDSLMRTLRKNQ